MIRTVSVPKRFRSYRFRRGVLTVDRAPVTVSTETKSKTYDGTPLEAGDPVVTGLAGSDAIEAAAVEGLTITGVGSVTPSLEWKWTSVGNADNYTVSVEPGTLTITVNSTPVTITALSASKVYDGEELVVDETTYDGLPDGIWAYGEVEGSLTDVGTAVNELTDYVIGDSNENDVTAYFSNVTLVDGTLEVTPRQVTVTSSSRPEKTYDGKPFPVSTENPPTIEGLIDAEASYVGVTEDLSPVDAGTYENTCSIDWNSVDKNNYAVTTNYGTLTISKAPLSVRTTTVASQKHYDGTPLTYGTLLVEGLVNDEEIEVTVVDGEITDVGSVTSTFDIEWITAKESNYALETRGSNLEIMTTRLVFDLKGPTVEYGESFSLLSATLTCEGTDIPCVAPSISQSGFEASYSLPAEGEAVRLTVSDFRYDATDPGTYPMTYTYSLGGKESNYEISFVNTALVINKPLISFVVTAPAGDNPLGYGYEEGGITAACNGTELVRTSMSTSDSRPTMTAVFDLPYGGGTVAITANYINLQEDFNVSFSGNTIEYDVSVQQGG